MPSTSAKARAKDMDSDGDRVVTMMEVLQEQEEFEEDATAVLGASDDKNCTFSKGYIKRQALYVCFTCCPESKTDPTKRAGVCLACSLTCHEDHDLVELYTKRNFCCDCGNPKFNNHPCQFTPNKFEINEDNIYDQNFSGLYCVCHRPYPDPESNVDDDMIQCVMCEDWLHSEHLEATVPNNEQYSEMICKECMEKNSFLHDYSEFVVNTEDIEVAIEDNEKSVNTIEMKNDTAETGSEQTKTKDNDGAENTENMHENTSEEKTNENEQEKQQNDIGELENKIEDVSSETQLHKSSDMANGVQNMEISEENSIPSSQENNSENKSQPPTQNENIEDKTSEQLKPSDDDKEQNNATDTEIKENPLTNESDNTVQQNVGITENDPNVTEQEKSNNNPSDVQEDKLSDCNDIATDSDNKRKISIEEVPEPVVVKKPRIYEKNYCVRPKGVKKSIRGSTFWPANFRQKLCICNECIAMYKDLSVLFIIDPDDTVSAYEALGMKKNGGAKVSQYDKGLQALSSLDRVQQINAMTEYNKMRDKLLDYLKSFKDRKEIVKEEDIKAFFADMKPKREPDGVYFCS